MKKIMVVMIICAHASCIWGAQKTIAKADSNAAKSDSMSKLAVEITKKVDSLCASIHECQDQNLTGTAQEVEKLANITSRAQFLLKKSLDKFIQLTEEQFKRDNSIKAKALIILGGLEDSKPETKKDSSADERKDSALAVKAGNSLVKNELP